MAGKIQAGETIYVSCSRVKDLAERGVALYKTKITEVDGQRARVDLPTGQQSEWISCSLLHRDVSILIINVGDFYSEHSLLDPLAKSVGQFCRLLVPDDQIRQVRVRSLDELETLWRAEQVMYSHVVWIGHGRKDGIKFAVDGWVDANKINISLRVHGAPKKTFISLCCQHGYKSFGGKVSNSAICRHFIGPFHSVPGAVASQFCQTFLSSLFLAGKTAGVAFKQARYSVPGKASFRLWNSGDLIAPKNS